MYGTVEKKISFDWEFFSSNWEKSHPNCIGNGALFRPLRHPKKIPVFSDDTDQFMSDMFKNHIGGFLMMWLSCDSLKTTMIMTVIKVGSQARQNYKLYTLLMGV